MREKYGLGLITPGICLHYINTYQELTMCKTLQDQKDESDIFLILVRAMAIQNSYENNNSKLFC